METRPVPDRQRVLPSSILLALALSLAGATHAACPQTLCDCLGAAKQFALVTPKKLLIKEGVVGYYGYTYVYEGFVDWDTCSPTALLSGPVDHPTYLNDVIALAPSGTAVRALARTKYRGETGYGVQVYTVATGGGRVVPEENVGGDIDVTGTYPKLPSCARAIADMEAASATLAALPPTQEIGTLDVRGDDVYLDMGPGVNVIAADRIRVLKGSYYGSYGYLHIDAGVADAVVINTKGLTVGTYGFISTYEPEKVIINVVGPGPAVRIGRFAGIEIPILAARRTVSVGVQAGDFYTVNIFANRITLKGASVFDVLSYICP